MTWNHMSKANKLKSVLRLKQLLLFQFLTECVHITYQAQRLPMVCELQNRFRNMAAPWSKKCQCQLCLNYVKIVCDS